MTGERMANIRAKMGNLPIRALARWAGRAESTLREMEQGKRSIPADFAAWWAAVGEFVDQHPAPAKRR